MRRAADRVAADSDARALAKPHARDLPDRLVGEGAGTRNDADVALLVNVARGDADAAAAGGVLAGAGGDDAGAVGADEARFRAGHGPFHPHHVAHWNAFGDCNHQLEAGVHAFEDGIGGEGRGHEDRGHGCAGGHSRLGDRVEDRNLVFLILEELAALARCDAGDNLRAVIERELRMAGAERAGDALNEDLGFGSDENGHGKK